MKVRFPRMFRFALLCMMLVLVSTLLTPPMPAQVISKSGHEFKYYSDATHHTQVGDYVYCRNGDFFHWGVITQFVVMVNSGC